MSGQGTVSGGGHIKVVTDAVQETAAAIMRFADEAREIATLLTSIDTTRPDTFVAESLPGIEFEMAGTICELQGQALFFDLLASRVVTAWTAYLAVESAQSWIMEALEASMWNAGGQVARSVAAAGALQLLISVACAGPIPGAALATRAGKIPSWREGVERLASRLDSRPMGGDPLRWFSTAEGALFIRHVVDNADDLELGILGFPAGVGASMDPQAREGVVRRWGALLPGPRDGRVTISEVVRSQPRPTSVDSLNGMVSNVPDGDPFENGRIRIDIVEGEDGVRRAVVYLGGTELTRGSAEDMASNISAYGDLDSGFMRAVEMAMRAELAGEGLPLDTPITFVGYSQGGLAASRLIESGHWNAAGLLTVGSPGNWIVLPDDLPHIAIEHRDDPIAALNGVERPWRRPDAVTYTASASTGAEPSEFLSGHKLDLYLHTAGDVDADTDRAIVEERTRLLANVAGTVVSSSAYAATRVEQVAPPAKPESKAAVPTPTPSGEGRVSDVRVQPVGGGGLR